MQLHQLILAGNVTHCETIWYHATSPRQPSFFTIFVQLPLGLSIAGTVRVGNELGAGQPQKAKRAAYICILVTCKREQMRDTTIVFAYVCYFAVMFFLCRHQCPCIGFAGPVCKKCDWQAFYFRAVSLTYAYKSFVSFKWLFLLTLTTELSWSRYQEFWTWPVFWYSQTNCRWE